MKVAVCSTGSEPASRVHAHFSSAPWFLLHDDQTGSWEAVVNAGGHVNGECAGGRLANLLAGEGVSAIITGQCGAGALMKLRAAGIAVYQAQGQSALEAIAGLRSGTLQLLSAACAHAAHHEGGQCHSHEHE